MEPMERVMMVDINGNIHSLPKLQVSKITKNCDIT